MAEYLAERGFIAEGVNRYELFVVTSGGSVRAAGTKDQIPRGRSLHVYPPPL